MSGWPAVPMPNGAPWRLYKREVFKELRFPYGYLFEDAATTHRAFMRAKNMALISARTYAYRVRPNSIVRMKFTEKKLICTTIGEQIIGDILQYDPGLKAAAYARAFAINYQVFIQIPPNDKKSLQSVWSCLRRYRGVVVRDKAPELRTKNRVGAMCTFLGMRFSHMAGRIYKTQAEKRKKVKILNGRS